MSDLFDVWIVDPDRVAAFTEKQDPTFRRPVFTDPTDRPNRPDHETDSR